MLPFSIQVAPPVLGLVAVIAMIADCFIQVCLRLLDRVLTVRPVIGMGLRGRCHKPHKCRCD